MAESVGIQLSRSGAVLSRNALQERLDYDLTVSPLLDRNAQVGDGSIDISLGTRFITSQRSQVATVDPMNLTEQKIRTFQRTVVTSFTDDFTLHPNSFVLGCTFEFIALPADLAAFVLTRSSYGRVGLVIATASFVHPGWHGCLTLELENLGEMPIILRPLSTVGQLVFISAAKLEPRPKLKHIHVGPTFSKLANESRWKKIRSLSQMQ